MPQIAFLTLFLGLTLGPQPIELTVTGPVAAVELLLDGAPAGRLTGPPWKGQIDFGTSLAPHQLVARALDGEGTEISRAEQWLNLPRQPAEVDILLENDAKGRPVAARLTWQSLTGEKPSAVGVTFDDRPLVLDTGGHVKLPAWSPETGHVLTAELRFSGALTARRDVVFGGLLGEVISSELTAVPVRLRPDKELPSPERMQGWFRAAGRPLMVAAVDEGPAELLVVRDTATQSALDRLITEYRRDNLKLGKDDAVRFIWPEARAVAGTEIPAELFDTSRDFTAHDGGLLWFLGRGVPRVGTPSRQRLADAVAVAGLQALYANHRRAVLLVLSEQASDKSRSDPALVRRYLESIRVPLIVWSMGDPAAPGVAAWGEAEDASSLSKMWKAFSHLEEELATQRIVWIDGRYLPQAIELSGDAASVLELVR